MCGIAGIVLKRRGKIDLPVAISAMLISQRHRGPDHTGTFFESDLAVGLGHNRLSIIDMTAAANQPFLSADSRFVITYNGEIYNYRELRAELEGLGRAFVSQSDTEVLLAAYQQWGEACLHRLNGMFAFAIWDTVQKVLFAARDRFGVKPFFYTESSEAFSFASEIKALFAAGVVSACSNERAWGDYLAFGTYATPTTTFWRDIRQLPGGHSMTIRQGVTTIARWYDFVARVSSCAVPLSYEAARDELWDRLRGSVALRLRSDVPIGLNLSGGIDSSVLYALTSTIGSELTRRVLTFHCSDPNYDERPWVTDIVKHGALPWTQVQLTVAEIPDFALRMQRMQDEPYAGIATLAYARVFEEARAAGIVVLLDGGGMDEHLAGYNYYGTAGNTPVQGTTQSPVRPECLDMNVFSAQMREPHFPEPFSDLVQNQQFRDLFITKLPRDLRFNDRMSMACSTELREPFLNHELVEFAFALPTAFKIRNGKRKEIVREKLRSVIHSELVEAPKRPVQTPQREWLRGPLQCWVRSMVHQAIRSSPFLLADPVQRELERFFAGEFDNSFFVWQWISLGLMTELHKPVSA